MRETPHHSVAGGRARSADALLILDMISCWDFPNAEQLLPHALRIAPGIARLCMRARARGIPVVYCNDNRGKWRSDFRELVERSLQGSDTARSITQTLLPDESDYFVLKPKHSAFYATPLHLLLETLSVRRLVLAGIASDQCVLSTAMDGRMRDFDVLVPQDTCATQSVHRHRSTVHHMQIAFRIPTPLSTALRWSRRA